MSDEYTTISGEGDGRHTEKMSRFLSFAFPVTTADGAKDAVASVTRRDHDARHICWAYMLGPERQVSMSNDNGEPSGTAGKPILGQINSFELTNIVIVVVRYFGGIKLGTSGLIVAYREAAAEAIRNAEIIECHEEGTVDFTFPYLSMNDVMKIAKGGDVSIVSQTFDNACTMTLSTRLDNIERLRKQLSDIDGVTLDD